MSVRGITMIFACTILCACGPRGGTFLPPADFQESMAREQLVNRMFANPDVPAWHTQREQMTLALGDRLFDRGFDRVFDSMIIALATLGCRVHNMERVSGYITASIPELSPEEQDALRKERNRQYAVANGYPADIFERPDPYGDSEPVDIDMTRFMSGLTLSMVKQGPDRTKVKLRFDNVLYPRMVERYYAIVWQAIDKQMFLDEGLD